jgi:hypothetical protein
MSQNVGILKAAIVRAEASHMIDDVEGVRREYAQAMAQNGALIGEYNQRANNHQELLKSLKMLNNLIRIAGNLRVGD